MLLLIVLAPHVKELMLIASYPVFSTATYMLVVCVEKVNVEVTPAGVLTWWMASEESGGGGGGDGGGGGVWHSTLAIQLKLTRMTSQTLQGAPPGCPRILTKVPCVSRVCVSEITHRHTFTFTQALKTPRCVPHGGDLKGRHAHGELEAHGGCSERYGSRVRENDGR